MKSFQEWVATREGVLQEWGRSLQEWGCYKRGSVTGMGSVVTGMGLLQERECYRIVTGMGLLQERECYRNGVGCYRNGLFQEWEKGVLQEWGCSRNGKREYYRNGVVTGMDTGTHCACTV
jgi:hypothetical protein